MELEKKIIDATRDVFSTMVLLETVPETALDPKSSLTCQISCMLGLAGDLRGMLAVHCPRELAGDITARLLGEEGCERDEDIRDAIAEITNMIAGGIKSAFSGEGKLLELAIPTTISGTKYVVRSSWNAAHIIIPFLAGSQRFWTELKFLDAAE